MFTIQNHHLKVSINSRGAELDSIFSKDTQLEYLWSGDAAFWNKKSPLLFPIVGALKNNVYYYQDKEYRLGRHGFAREREFECIEQSERELSFRLVADDETMKLYPFLFALTVTYRIEGGCLSVTYTVMNTGKEDLFFSIGGHPAFKLPIEPALQYDDYYLEFEQHEHAMRWLISGEGLIEPVPVPYFEGQSVLRLSKELFMKDALVFKDLKSETIAIKTKKSPHGIDMKFAGFPFLGIWAAPDADFVCLEPWCGIADSTDHNQQLTHKEGIHTLSAGQSFQRNWQACFY